MRNNKILLLPGQCYHIFNHANGFENLFQNEGNYHYFLEKYAARVNPIAGTLSYCLMPNHLHLMVRIKSLEYLPLDIQKLNDPKAIALKISNLFGALFNGYAQAFNRQQGRMGSLFIPNFKRRPVTHATYYSNLVRYIHYNAVEHGFVSHPALWPHSSFMDLLSDRPTHLLRDEVLSSFGGRDGFLAAHDIAPDDRVIRFFNEW